MCMSRTYLGGATGDMFHISPKSSHLPQYPVWGSWGCILCHCQWGIVFPDNLWTRTLPLPPYPQSCLLVSMVVTAWPQPPCWPICHLCSLVHCEGICSIITSCEVCTPYKLWEQEPSLLISLWHVSVSLVWCPAYRRHLRNVRWANEWITLIVTTE